MAVGMPGFAGNRVWTPNRTELNPGPVRFGVRVRKDPNFRWGSGSGFTGPGPNPELDPEPHCPQVLESGA